MKKYSDTYLRLLAEGVDDLIQWIYKSMEMFPSEGQKIFDIASCEHQFLYSCKLICGIIILILVLYT